MEYENIQVRTELKIMTSIFPTSMQRNGTIKYTKRAAAANFISTWFRRRIVRELSSTLIFFLI